MCFVCGILFFAKHLYVFEQRKRIYFEDILYYRFFFIPLQRLISLLVRGDIFCLTFYLNFFNIKSFALSIIELSKEARYICVVFSESCPMPALMTERGMFWLLAILAHEWRLTYIVSLVCKPIDTDISLSLLLTRRSAFLYCNRSFRSFLMIGSK